MKTNMLSIQHYLNPLHVHCRLVGMGLDKTLSISLCRGYEVLVYGWLSALLVYWLHTLRMPKM